MNNPKLANYFTLERRYTRSINLERDFDDQEALKGYILTDKAIDVLGRILQGLTKESNSNCWTLTGVYGTGKSAFCHYLGCLLSPKKSNIYKSSFSIIESISKVNNELIKDYEQLINNLPRQGFIRAIAVSQRESITNTIIRALSIGLNNFKLKNKSHFQEQLESFNELIKQGKNVKNSAIISLIKEIISQAKTDLIFIIDELGKNLEYAVYNQGAEDVYLLQQLAELEPINGNRVYILGILHQAFTEYGQRLGKIQRNEWAKIQGRFEDIPFTESVAQMMRLMGEAINIGKEIKNVDGDRQEARGKRQEGFFQDSSYSLFNYDRIVDYSQQWFDSLYQTLSVEKIDKSILENIYPLHPLTALVLPTLCMRYAQNDRTLFTFITSDEPFSLKNFLTETVILSEGIKDTGEGRQQATGNRQKEFLKDSNCDFVKYNLPTLKLDRVYDYFIESAGMGLTSRPNLQRWIEIHDLIADSKSLDEDSLRVLKVIGILNLVTITGITKATRQLVAYGLCDLPQEEEVNYWQEKIDGLLKGGIITYRRQIDELRIWQGSDFNVDQELESYQDSESLVKLLSELRPLKPMVAQRHSYQTGTLRYFERHYLDSFSLLDNKGFKPLVKCDSNTADGYLGYWLDDDIPSSFPSSTVDGLPVIIITASNLPILRLRVREFSALNWLDKTAKELQADGVARKEVRYRLAEAERFLDDTLANVFDVREENNQCWIQGELVNISSISQLNFRISRICEQVYPKSPILWNELINRRNLTAQGMMARRQLISAMVNNSTMPQLGLTGYGPEVTMYFSLLQETGIHRISEGLKDIGEGRQQLFSLNTSLVSGENKTSEDNQITPPDTRITKLTENNEEEWGFYPPISRDNPNVTDIWSAIASFCTSATEKPENISKLYQLLSKPPYGVKEGIIPVILASVLLYYREEVGVYQDGTFAPVLGEEHFELLVKNPERYGVKYFAIEGLRGEIFKELETILSNSQLKDNSQVRNATLLSVVTPLYQFVKKLPRYTQQTKNLSKTALQILHSLQQTVEPDELLFSALPSACGLSSISFTSPPSQEVTQIFKTTLIKGLREINQAYDTLLNHCQSLLNTAFGVEGDKLRANLRIRGYNIKDKCVERSLKRFTQAIIDDSQSDSQWLSAVVMVIADKPAESWSDEDAIAFEVKLADIVRKFENLEAIQTEVNSQGIQEGVTARRITVTRDDGKETLRMVWIDDTREKEAEELVNQILTQLKGCDRKLREAVLAKLTEKILN
ncbi:hypothetical protein [Cyanobacterium aponinum]|uniref:hypothetical protein n=1 Tax=Cyanobacterium aponinum TaxID=379064 RepID=UPI000C129E27|nr:hypothetical protein [Cyanobacterium aponinum]PHV63302.1 hypothetical protein CSQ80_06075 [Cyanobacterium aponinum IPPAS B-1201]